MIERKSAELTQKELKARDAFRALSHTDKIEFIKTLSPIQANRIRFNPIYWLRDKQIVPPGTWRYCFVRSGRGFGKTKMGAAWVKLLTDANPGKKGFMAVIAPTHGDLTKVMVPAILEEFSKTDQPAYVEQKQEIRFKNGSTIHCYASDTEVRGGNYEYVWCDEMVKWCDSLPGKIKEAFDTLDAACRKGESKFLITTTPKPFPIFKRWERMAQEGNPLVVMVSGKMTENDALSEQAKQALYAQFGNTRYGRQELEGEILTDTEGALWAPQYFDDNRVATEELPELIRTVVAIDPAVSSNKNSDETGMVVAALGIDGLVYVLEDASAVYTPNQWARKANALYRSYKADRVIAEKNNGGELVEANLRTVNVHLPYKAIHASKGKVTRAEPVAALYEQSRVKHVGMFKELEDQCCSYSGHSSSESPDRMDALVYAITELLLTRTYTRRDVEWVPYY